MNRRKSDPVAGISDAAWAHNRWPAIGASGGAGLGLVLGVVFWVGWLRTILLIIALVVAGCFLGFAAAKLMYLGVDRRRRDQEKAD